MKKFFRIVCALLLMVIVAVIVKNFILRYTYHFDVEYFSKVDSSNGYNEYRATVDTYECGPEMRSCYCIKIYPDSTGTFCVDSYLQKIDGRQSNLYTFHSLLPYDESKKLEEVSRLKLCRNYLCVFEKADTVYYKYKIDGCRLYIDKGHYSPAEEKPEWGFQFNAALGSFGDMFKFCQL